MIIMKKSISLAHSAMCALVAAYTALIVLLTCGRTMPIPVFVLLSAACFAMLKLLARRFSGLSMHAAEKADPFPIRVFLAAALLCMLSFGVYMAGFFPGGLSSDTVIQWVQAHTPAFDDRHPVLHTLLIYLLTRIVSHPAFCVGVQMLCFSCAVGYMAAVIARWRLPRLFRIGVTAYLCMSPAICNVMTFLWKDCAFAISVLFLGAQILEIHFSRGEWLRKPLHLLALSVVLCLASILRHNGPAMTLAAGVWLLLSLRGQRRRLILSFLLSATLFFGIKGPLYDAVGTDRISGGLSETYGVPMVVLAHVYSEAPQSIDEETKIYLETIAPWETYHTYDNCGDWNEIKWHLGQFDISAYTLPQVFSFAARAALREPQLAIEALAGLWQMPLLPFGHSYWRISPYIDPVFFAWFSDLDAGIPLIRRVLNALCRYSAEPAVSWLFWNPGFPLLIVMAACCLFAHRRTISALAIPAMLICYNLVTALVLSSPTDFRFYLTTFMLAPLCFCTLFFTHTDRSETGCTPQSSFR